MMQALTADLPSTVSDRAANAAWAKPERGFDDWTVREDLEAADRVLATLERDLTDRFEHGQMVPGETRRDERDPANDRASHPCPPPAAFALRYLFPVGSAALLVGASLLVGSCFGDRSGLWDGGLTVIVIGQTALLLASLASSR